MEGPEDFRIKGCYHREWIRRPAIEDMLRRVRLIARCRFISASVNSPFTELLAAAWSNFMVHNEKQGDVDSISTTLLGGVKLNDGEAWTRLVLLYGPLVFSWCRRAGLQSEDAADVGQEVFRGVAGAIGDFRRARPADSFVAWLRVITRNKIADFQRAAGRRPLAVGGSNFMQSIEAVLPSGEQKLGAGDNSAAVDAPAKEIEAGSFDELQASTLGTEVQQVYRRAMELIRAEFREKTWQAFWETTVLERPTAEVAESLAMSNVAVRKAKSRVLRRLREEFGDAEG